VRIHLQHDDENTLFLFRHLPLPLTMIFHEMACQCVHHYHTDASCCVGNSASIAAPRMLLQDDDDWTRTICRRVDHALDEMCFSSSRWKEEL
jgi:hypothetical protein